MKLSLIALTALFAAPSASAFMAPQPAASNSALFSTMGGDAGLATGVGTPKVNTPSSPGGEMALTKDVWDTLSPIKVQGGSLRTWSFTTPAIDSVQVHLKTEGRPLNANGKTNANTIESRASVTLFVMRSTRHHGSSSKLKLALFTSPILAQFQIFLTNPFPSSTVFFYSRIVART